MGVILLSLGDQRIPGRVQVDITIQVARDMCNAIFLVIQLHVIVLGM